MILSATKYLFAAIGLGLLLGAAAVYSHTASFVSRASRAHGTVTAMLPQRSSSNGTTYKPVVRFELAGGQMEFADSVSSNPPAYQVGEAVSVLYLESSPNDAKIDSFMSLWFLPTLLGGMGAIFLALGGGLILVPALLRRTDERLLHQGTPIEAEFQGVSVNSSISVNGRCPYRVTAQWLDPATSRMRVFQSHNVWFDPTAYIKDKTLKVFLDPNNPSRYYMDLSFLPKLAG